LEYFIQILRENLSYFKENCLRRADKRYLGDQILFFSQVGFAARQEEFPVLRDS